MRLSRWILLFCTAILVVVSVSAMMDSCWKEDVWGTQTYSNEDAVRIYESGVVTRNGVKFYDFCADENTLVKYYCESGGVNYIYFNCMVNNETCRSGVCTSNPELDEIRWMGNLPLTEKQIRKIRDRMKQEENDRYEKIRKLEEEYENELLRESFNNQKLDERLGEVKPSPKNWWSAEVVITIILLIIVCSLVFFFELQKRKKSTKKKKGEQKG